MAESIFMKRDLATNANVIITLKYANGSPASGKYVNCFDGTQWYNYAVNDAGMAVYTLNKGINAFFNAEYINTTSEGHAASGVWVNGLSYGHINKTITYTKLTKPTVTAWLRYNNGSNISGWYVNFYDGSWHNSTTNTYGKYSITANVGTVTVYSPSKTGYSGGGYNNVTVNWGGGSTRYLNFTPLNKPTVTAWLRYNNGSNISGWYVNFYDGSWHNLTTNSYGKASITANVGWVNIYTPSKSGCSGGYNNVYANWESSYTRYLWQNVTGTWHYVNYTSNGTFTAPVSATYSVICYGGGGGAVFICDNNYFGFALDSCGGGGGWMNNGSFYLSSGTSVPITIGSGGTGVTNTRINLSINNITTAYNGGTTSFGTYMSAQGGGGATAGYKTLYKTFYGKGGNGGSGGGVSLGYRWSNGGTSFLINTNDPTLFNKLCNNTTANAAANNSSKGIGYQFGNGCLDVYRSTWTYKDENNHWVTGENTILYIEATNSSTGGKIWSYNGTYYAYMSGGGGYNGPANIYGGGGISISTGNYGSGGDSYNTGNISTSAKSGLVQIKWYG